MNPILTHKIDIFSYTTIYLLSTGSFYICYKAKEKLYLPHKNGYGQIYNISLMVYIFIIGIGIGLSPELMKNMFNYKLSVFWMLITAVLGILFGAFYVDFEAWLCKARKAITLTGKNVPKTLCLIVTMIAIFEEIIFRGFINEIGFLVGGKIGIALIIFGILSFGLSHLYAGWVQFFSKTIFASVMTLFYILSGGVLVPMLSHAVFNYWVVKKYPQGINSQ